MNRRAVCALLGALMLAGCSKAGETSGGGPGSGRHAWTQPGELRIGIQSEPLTLNPLLSANTVEGLLNRLSFNTLVSVEPDGKTLVPMLAAKVPSLANGGISPDGLTVSYVLRSRVTWQDGVPFTSKDVKFSWQAMLNDNNNVNARVGYDDVRSVDTPNATTVIFHLRHKFAPFVNTVFSESDDPVCIVPEHILGKYKDVNHVPFNALPIGTGPFKVIRWVRGDHVELEANPNYFLGPPKLKRVIVRIIPDENTSINALRTHDIDWMFEPSPNLYAILKTLPETAIHFVDQPQTLRLLMNLKHAPLGDVRVRRAIAYAIDKKALVERLTGGSARVAGADQPPFSWAYNPNIVTYGPDVAKATALLARAGYAPGADGIMQKKGQPLRLELSTNTANATRRLVQTQVQSMLRAIGIEAEIKNYPGSMLFATYGQGGILATGKFDLAVTGWVAGIDPDDHSLYQCNQAPPAGVNYDRYCSAAMDDAQAAALSSYAEAPRKEAYFTIQDLMTRDVPEIILWYARNPQATNPDFKGFAPNPVNEAWNAYQWEI